MHCVKSLPALTKTWSILDGITLGATHGVESHDPAVVKSDHVMEKEVCVAVGWVLV